jgi:multidrug efflux pump subunit AcrB
MPRLRSHFIYPTTLAFCTALAVIVGCSSPVAGANAMTVTVSLPGASAVVVDSAVASPISRALLGVPGLTRLEVESHPGRCSAVIRFGPHADMDAAAQAVHEAMTKAAPTLPAACGPAQMVFGDLGELPALWIAVKSDRANNEAVTEIARRLVRNDLAQLQGTARVELVGAVNSVPTLWLDADKLAALHLTAGEVSRAVKNAPAQIGAELGDIIIRADDAQPIRARDVARFERAIHEDGFAAVDSVRCVLVTIESHYQTVWRTS